MELIFTVKSLNAVSPLLTGGTGKSLKITLNRGKLSYHSFGDAGSWAIPDGPWALNYRYQLRETIDNSQRENMITKTIQQL